MRRELHVRFCEGGGVRSPSATRLVILVGVPDGADQLERAEQAAEQEKRAVAELLRTELKLELSEAKTLVTPVTGTLKFLGHHVRVRPVPGYGYLTSSSIVPRDRSAELRWRIKNILSRKTTYSTLAARLEMLNPLLRGWANFYRHAYGAKAVFRGLDHYVWWTIYRWLRRKHDNASLRELQARFGRRLKGSPSVHWADGSSILFPIRKVRVTQFKMGWRKTPDFAKRSSESPVQIESCTPGSEGGAQKPSGASRERR